VIEAFNVCPTHYLTAPISGRPDESKYMKVREVIPGVDSIDQEKMDAALAPFLKVERNVFRNSDYQNQFENDGYVVLDILNEEEIRTLLDTYGEIEENLFKMPFATLGMNSDNASKRKVSDVMKQVFADKIEEIFDDYQWFFGTFIYKYPSVKTGEGVVSLHQDATIVDESKYHGINIFCSLGTANEENGALQVIPGSHKLNTHPRGFGQSFPYSDLERTLSSQLKRIDLNPGQAIIYTTKIFHYSEPNTSNSPRIIAAGIVGPRESTMRYCYVDRENEGKIEVFEVDSDYYLTAPFFSKPDASQYRLIEEIEIQFESLDADVIEKKLSLSKCH
jgi:hypothetical protein